MSQIAARTMSVDAFFAFQERQDERYELVDGVPLRMMAGARAVHNSIVINILAELRDRLRGSACRPFNGDGSVETYPGQIRRPDAGVDCGPYNPNALKAVEPRLIVEVLSPSTRDFDTMEKVEEYKAIATLADILFVEPNAPELVHWFRDEAGLWRRERIEGIESAVTLGGLGIELPLAAVYDGIPFPAVPQG